MIGRLTDTHETILRELARYKFLTRQHMIDLGIKKHNSHLQSYIEFLRDRKAPFIGCTSTANIVDDDKKLKLGRLPAFYYLKKFGVSYIQNNMEVDDIKYPRSFIFEKNDKHHHLSGTLNCEIALRALDKELRESGGHPLNIQFVDRYFDFTGSQKDEEEKLASKTKIDYSPFGQYLMSDMIFMIEPYDKFLYCLEYHRGVDSARALKEIEQYRQALQLGTPSEKYGEKVPCRILWVFEKESCMKAVISRAKQDPLLKNFLHLFLCRTESSLDSFFRDWQNLNGDIVNLF